jgi:membrane peptidoglycan carboxypeptidase
VAQRDHPAAPGQIRRRGSAVRATGDGRRRLRHATGGPDSERLGLLRPGPGPAGRRQDRTSSDSKSAWFVGFTPQLSTSVAMYRMGKNWQRSSPSRPSADSGRSRRSFPGADLDRVHAGGGQGLPVEEFPQPSWGGEIQGQAPPTTAPVSPTVSESVPPLPTSSMTQTPEFPTPERSTRNRCRPRPSNPPRPRRPRR